MADTAAVKQAIVDLLKNDTDMQTLLGKDRQGETPVYLGYENILKKTWFPCVTVDEVSESGETSGLSDGYDGLNVSEWYYAVIQVDCWAKTAEQRDSLLTQVKKTILKGKLSLQSSGIIMISEPTVTALDEPDAKPPIFRRSIRYRVFYILEAAV